MTRFADPAHVAEGWYVLARGASLKPRQVRRVDVGGRDVVVWRGADGRAGALDARCAHLGADLAEGRVEDDGLRCAYHGWCWSAEGACVRAEGRERPPARRARAYRVVERHGLVWAWLGGTPAFDVPEQVAPPGWRRIVLPPQRIACHPHLVLGNGYDLGHLAPAHGITLDAPPHVAVEPPQGMRLDTRGRLGRAGAIRLLGMGGKPFDSTYRTLGATITLVEVRAPTRFVVLFTGRPDKDGHCRAQTVLHVPRLAALPRALAVLWTTTLQDIRIMESLRFRPAFDEADEVLATYAKLVEGIPAW